MTVREFVRADEGFSEHAADQALKRLLTVIVSLLCINRWGVWPGVGISMLLGTGATTLAAIWGVFRGSRSREQAS